MSEQHEAEKRFAERIRMVRRAYNWSVQEVARRSGMTRVAISKIENGGRSVGLGDALDLAHALGVPLDDLVRPGTFTATATIAIEVDA